MEKKKHRGRFQAQGGGIEESESWSQDEPLTKKQARQLLDKLKDKLPEAERQVRKKPFEAAERFIEGAKGGVQAPEHRSFRNRQTRDVRVDIEVWSGIAFLTITLIILALWKIY